VLIDFSTTKTQEFLSLPGSLVAFFSLTVNHQAGHVQSLEAQEGLNQKSGLMPLEPLLLE